MIINGIDFDVIVNVKKMRTINMRIKLIDGKYCLVINSFKKLKEKDILDLIARNKKGMDRLIKNRVINPLKDDETIILGKIYKKCDVTQKIVDNAFLEIENLFNKYKKVFNHPNTILKYRKMRSRWGACFINEDMIKLTTHIVHLPMYLIEYIVIHEFCHFTFANHSKDFYQLVSNYCPDYKLRVKEIKKYLYVLD